MNRKPGLAPGVPRSFLLRGLNRRQPLYDIALLVQEFELGRALSVHHQLQTRPTLRIGERQRRGLLPGLAYKHALRAARGRRVTEFLHGLRLLRSVGHILNSLKLVYHFSERRIGSVPHSQTCVILAVAFSILDADRLILPEPVESQQRARAGFAVLLITAETQAAALIALFIEEKYSRRPRPRESLPVNDAGVLSFAVGNDHL